MSADDIIAGWILREWSKPERKGQVNETELHIWNCGPSVESADVSWECNCYSDYTRDDDQILVARISCEHGTSTEYRYGRYWDMPMILQEILDDRCDDLADNCPYEDEVAE